MSTTQPPPKIVCPHCQAAIKSPGLPAGTRVTCPKCGQPFAIGQPKPAQPPAPKSPAAPANPKSQISNPKSASAPSAQGKPTPTPHSAVRNPQSQPAPKPSAPPTVDPLQLGPTPPPKPPPAKEVAIVCKLCGTRMYAPLAKIGQTMPCPDCHTPNEIKQPVVAKKPKAGPTLEGAEEFAMSDPVERPAYRPLVAPRGDFAELSQFEPGAHPPGWTPPDPADSVGAARGESAEDGDEFTLAAPVERIELREPVRLPPREEPDADAAIYDGRYNDDLIGEGVDSRDPDAWKMAPFRYGLLEFLVQGEAISRIVMYAIGLTIVLFVLHGAVKNATTPGALSQFMAIPFSMASGISAFLWLLPFSACLLAIVQDTANGQREVEGWPDWNFLSWLASAFYFPVAGFIAGLPGAVVASGLIAGGMPPIAAPLLVLVSWLVLLPIVLYSMLAEGSILSVMSAHTTRSFQAASDGWMLFYVYSLALGIFAAAADGLASLPYFAAQAAGAVGLVASAFMYCRLLGRLMWYGVKKSPREEPAESGSA